MTALEPAVPYTPLEALLIFSQLQTNGTHSSSFLMISNTLLKNALLRASEGYDKNRLSPDALRDFFHYHIQQAQNEFGPIDGIAGAHSGSGGSSDGCAVSPKTPRKKKGKNSPPAIAGLPPSPGGNTSEIVKMLTRRFYERYLQFMVGSIKQDEEKYVRVRTDIQEIEAGRWDAKFLAEMQIEDERKKEVSEVAPVVTQMEESRVEHLALSASPPTPAVTAPTPVPIPAPETPTPLASQKLKVIIPPHPRKEPQLAPAPVSAPAPILPQPARPITPIVAHVVHTEAVPSPTIPAQQSPFGSPHPQSAPPTSRARFKSYPGAPPASVSPISTPSVSPAISNRAELSNARATPHSHSPKSVSISPIKASPYPVSPSPAPKMDAVPPPPPDLAATMGPPVPRPQGVKIDAPVPPPTIQNFPIASPAVASQEHKLISPVPPGNPPMPYYYVPDPRNFQTPPPHAAIAHQHQPLGAPQPVSAPIGMSGLQHLADVADSRWHQRQQATSSLPAPNLQYSPGGRFQQDRPVQSPVQNLAQSPVHAQVATPLQGMRTPSVPGPVHGGNFGILYPAPGSGTPIHSIQRHPQHVHPGQPPVPHPQHPQIPQNPQPIQHPQHQPVLNAPQPQQPSQEIRHPLVGVPGKPELRNMVIAPEKPTRSMQPAVQPGVPRPLSAAPAPLPSTSLQQIPQFFGAPPAAPHLQVQQAPQGLQRKSRPPPVNTTAFKIPIPPRVNDDVPTPGKLEIPTRPISPDPGEISPISTPSRSPPPPESPIRSEKVEKVELGKEEIETYAPQEENNKPKRPKPSPIPDSEKIPKTPRAIRPSPPINNSDFTIVSKGSRASTPKESPRGTITTHALPENETERELDVADETDVEIELSTPTPHSGQHLNRLRKKSSSRASPVQSEKKASKRKRLPTASPASSEGDMGTAPHATPDLEREKEKEQPDREREKEVPPRHEDGVLGQQPMVVATKKFLQLSAPLLSDINSHKFANLFMTPVNERVAPGYRGMVYRPQDLKSIKAAVKAGAASLAATSATPTTSTPSESPAPTSTFTTVPATTLNTPPKGIVNSKQLEKEMFRMFANAVMYNKSTTEIAKETVEMARDVSHMVDNFRSAEEAGNRKAAVVASAGGGGGGAGSGAGGGGKGLKKEEEVVSGDEGEDEEEEEEEEEERKKRRKKRR
ncbi:hypothetical protein RUND412_007189 [Rhizina undulata]